MYSVRKSVASSESIPGKISGAISMTVTSDPNVLNNPANSNPITPPPTMMSDFGTIFDSRASLLVQKAVVSTPLIGGITVSDPVQSSSFLASNSSSLQLILTLFSALCIDASPLTNVTLFAVIFARIPAFSLRTILFLRATIFS